MTQKPDNPHAMMTNEQLAEAVARMKELDAMRTQGEWSYEPQDFSPERVWAGTKLICNVVGDSAETEETAAFIAHAPQMAAIIQQQRDVMRQAREALSDCKDYVDSENLTMQTKHRHWGYALAALDAALKGSE